MATVSVRYIVHDVDEAISFYRDQLGFTEVMRPAPTFAMLARGDLRLVLEPRRAADREEVRRCLTERFRRREDGTASRSKYQTSWQLSRCCARAAHTFETTLSLAWAESRFWSRTPPAIPLSYSNRPAIRRGWTLPERDRRAPCRTAAMRSPNERAIGHYACVTEALDS